MIGTHLKSASNVLDVLVQSGDWKRDETLKQATLRLSRALEKANQLPELQAAYRETIDAYATWDRCQHSQIERGCHDHSRSTH
jgi:hypothetical protein